MNQLNTCILIGAALLITVNSSAVFAQSKISAGINAGAGISSLYGNGYGANKLHAHIGIPINFEINKNLEVQTTVFLSSKGYASSFYKPSERMKLNYVDLVATLKYFPYKIAFIGGGMYASGLLSSQYRYLAYSNDYYGEPDISAIVNKFDYGLNGSIGCQFDNGVGFDFSVLFGLRDVLNSNISDTLVGYYGYPYVLPAEANGNNMVISTSFYYLFGKKNDEMK